MKKNIYSEEVCTEAALSRHILVTFTAKASWISRPLGSRLHGHCSYVPTSLGGNPVGLHSNAVYKAVRINIGICIMIWLLIPLHSQRDY